MKTSVKTLFASALTSVVLFTSAFTSEAADKIQNSSELATTIEFNKVVITGNVKVDLIQSDKQKVVIFEAYDKDLTTVMQKGDKLFINSTEDAPISITVYVKDLHRIDASNQVTVVTKGRFSSNVLQVFLQDNARAYVNGDINSLYTLIKDHSALKLKGTSKDHVSIKGKVAKLNTVQFASLKTTGSIDGEVLAQEYELSVTKDTVVARSKVR